MAKKILQSHDYAGNQIIAARIENLANYPAAGSAGRMVFNTTTNQLGYDDGSQFVPLSAAAWADVTGKPTEFPPEDHTHPASEITDFTTAVNTRIAAYWDTLAGTDADVDTIRELLDVVLANKDDLQAQIGRFDVFIGNGTLTSYNINHGLNSTDVAVEVYEAATGDTVGVDVKRVDANTVRIGANPAPATNSLKVVIKK